MSFWITPEIVKIPIGCPNNIVLSMLLVHQLILLMYNLLCACRMYVQQQVKLIKHETQKTHKVKENSSFLLLTNILMLDEHLNSDCSRLYLAQKLHGLDRMLYTADNSHTLVHYIPWCRMCFPYKHTQHFGWMCRSVSPSDFFLMDHKATA